MNSLDAVLQQIESHGERLTIQRRMVVEAVCSRTGHLSINDIRDYIEAKHPGHHLPEPTIYRILQWLKALELISQTDIGESGIVYELVSTPPHHHVICLNCGAVVEVDDGLFASLRERLHDEYDFDPRIEHMAIYGYCARCRPD